MWGTASPSRARLRTQLVHESLTRQFDHDNTIVQLTVIPVTTPPGVRDVFSLFSSAGGGFDSVPEPALDLAGWLVSPGSQVGDNGNTTLVFASRDHVFIFAMFTDEAAGIDAPAFVLDLAGRQVEAAGGPPPPLNTSRDTSHDDEVTALLPAEPPAEYNLTSSATVTGSDELPVDDEVQSEVVDFLNEHSVTATRVWSDDTGDLLAAVSVTRYPYGIFAASSSASSSTPTTTSYGRRTHSPTCPMSSPTPTGRRRRDDRRSDRYGVPSRRLLRSRPHQPRRRPSRPSGRPRWLPT